MQGVKWMVGLFVVLIAGLSFEKCTGDEDARVAAGTEAYTQQLMAEEAIKAQDASDAAQAASTGAVDFDPYQPAPEEMVPDQAAIADFNAQQQELTRQRDAEQRARLDADYQTSRLVRAQQDAARRAERSAEETQRKLDRIEDRIGSE